MFGWDSARSSVASGRIRVLSVDILLNPDVGDLTKPNSLDMWSKHIVAGRIAAIGGGPRARPSAQPGGKTGAPLRCGLGVIRGV